MINKIIRVILLLMAHAAVCLANDFAVLPDRGNGTKEEHASVADGTEPVVVCDLDGNGYRCKGAPGGPRRVCTYLQNGSEDRCWWEYN